MKTKLLSLLFFVFTIYVAAQTTYNLNWKLNIGTNIDLTVNINDIVTWTWTDGIIHNVTSSSGSSETFNSPDLTGNGQTYSYTFTKAGSNPYVCTYHSGNMSGTITVSAPLGIEDASISNFSISPNPAKNYIKIQLPQSIAEAKIEVFNILGKQIYSNANYRDNPIDITSWERGITLIKVSSEGQSKIKKFIKQ
ncbi:T9SS type A sorting domain-containing protein [Mariniflexile sp. AS56]|uniref:T9SS type A sorting domain-containing protein n=1 Tax=Mariniflexile sp. AS56 TaxID=3063957 RepID=UPI0026EA3817|nr:T9SS type A sorting domain-containing protein [Mariniflexile sp. AS56]MDO7170637.1 T9SS type A sorting domain-containing protein [Mariniflexile sp. AS56]